MYKGKEQEHIYMVDKERQKILGTGPELILIHGSACTILTFCI